MILLNGKRPHNCQLLRPEQACAALQSKPALRPCCRGFVSKEALPSFYAEPQKASEPHAALSAALQVLPISCSPIAAPLEPLTGELLVVRALQHQKSPGHEAHGFMVHDQSIHTADIMQVTNLHTLDIWPPCR